MKIKFSVFTLPKKQKTQTNQKKKQTPKPQPFFIYIH